MLVNELFTNKYLLSSTLFLITSRATNFELLFAVIDRIQINPYIEITHSNNQ